MLTALRPVARAGAVLAAAALAAAAMSAPARADVVRQQEMWVLDALGTPAAWHTSQGHGVTVAVIDSGVDPAVSDLTGSVITGPNLSGVPTPRANPGWGVHGTWMASLIAGHGHAGGGSGIKGIAPQARVLSIRVVPDRADPAFHRYQRESAERVQRDLAAAIRYAASHGARVISMSLGYDAASGVVGAALQAALARGVVVVASAGNSGGTAHDRRTGHAPYSFPANYPGVLSVAAVAQGGAPAGFSSDNLSVQVAAPGVKVPAQGRDNGYWLVSGTSPACALVAGVAALIKGRYPGLAPALVDDAITGSATGRPRGGYDQSVGYGTVNATSALTLARRLSHDTPDGRGAAVTSFFGGGPRAVAPLPVPSRGDQSLITYGLLGAVSLAVGAACLAGRRRAARVRAGQ